MKIPDILKKSVIQNKRTLTLAIVLIVLISLLDLFFSLLLKDAIDATASENMELLKLCAIKSAGLIVSYGIVYKLYCAVRNRFLFSAICSYRTAIFDRMIRQNYKDFRQHSSAEYLAMLSANMETIKEEAFDPICRIVSLTVTGTGALIIMISCNWILTGIALAVALIPLYISYRAGKPLALLNKEAADQQARFVERAQNLLNNHKDILVSKRYEFANGLYEKQSTSLEEAALKKRKCVQTMSWIGALNALVSQLGIGCAGGWIAIQTGTLTAGQVVVFIQLLNYIIEPVTELPALLSRQSGAVQLAKTMEETLKENRDSPALLQIDSIGFDHVCFRFPGQEILKDFSYTFLSGRSYLVRAPSGFGKSTLLQLILGIHEPSSGRIVYNGKSGYTTDALLENIAWMPQSQELLHGTVEENITFSSVYQKMDRVAIDFKGNADILSGGQKQRVILNRILHQNKDWILLDEPTAGMDPGLQERVLRSILGSKKTCIVVMHTEEESVLSLFDEIIDLS